MLELYDTEEKELFKNLRAKKSLTTGTIDLASVIAQITASGYPLPLDEACLSYFNHSEKCYVFAGPVGQIRTLMLMVPESALYQAKRLIIRTRRIGANNLFENFAGHPAIKE